MKKDQRKAGLVMLAVTLKHVLSRQAHNTKDSLVHTYLSLPLNLILHY